MPLDIGTLEVIEFETGRAAVDADRSAPPGATEGGYIVLHEFIRDNLVVSSMDMTGKNQCVIWFQDVINSFPVAQYLRDIIIVEVTACPVPFAESRRYMHRDGHFHIFSYIREVAFHPTQLSFRKIADVEPVFSYEEIIVQDYIVNLSYVERVV